MRSAPAPAACQRASVEPVPRKPSRLVPACAVTSSRTRPAVALEQRGDGVVGLGSGRRAVHRVGEGLGRRVPGDDDVVPGAVLELDEVAARLGAAVADVAVDDEAAEIGRLAVGVEQDAEGAGTRAPTLMTEDDSAAGPVFCNAKETPSAPPSGPRNTSASSTRRCWPDRRCPRPPRSANSGPASAGRGRCRGTRPIPRRRGCFAGNRRVGVRTRPMVEEARADPPPGPAAAPAKAGSPNGSALRQPRLRSAASGERARPASIAADHCVPSPKRTRSIGAALACPRSVRLSSLPDEPRDEVIAAPHHTSSVGVRPAPSRSRSVDPAQSAPSTIVSRPEPRLKKT